MAKKPKQKQTEWNIQGKQTADTAVPMWQSNLKRMDNYLADPSAAIDNYLNKYYDNTTEQSDFIRNYNRAVSAATANNYAATGGGYDTSNQRLYDDTQRYMNDWAAKLRDKGVSTSANMAYQDYANMLKGNEAYQNAYAMGQPYSQVDNYNYQVGQTNKWYNQLGGLLGTAGAVVGNVVAPGVGGYIGGALGNAIGDAVTIEPSGTPTTSNAWAQLGTNVLANYYNQQYQNSLAPNTARSVGSTATQGQFINPTQQTANFLNGANANNSLDDYEGELFSKLRKRGLIK